MHAIYTAKSKYDFSVIWLGIPVRLVSVRPPVHVTT